MKSTKNDDSIISMKEVVERTSVSRKTIYRWQAAGLFPQSIEIGPKRIGFLKSEFNAWLTERVTKSRGMEDAY